MYDNQHISDANQAPFRAICGSHFDARIVAQPTPKNVKSKSLIIKHLQKF
jgi:hypothetical protein